MKKHKRSQADALPIGDRLLTLREAAELPVPLPTCLSLLSMPRDHIDGPPLYGLTVPNLPNVA